MNYFDYEYRIRYGDTDKLGISYYANYLVWFEAARTEYFRALGLPYTECEKKGIYLPVAEAYAKYLAPTSYDDLIIVRTSVSELKISSIHFEYQVLKKGDTRFVATGFTRHVFVDKNLRPVRMPEEVRSIVTPHKLLPA